MARKLLQLICVALFVFSTEQASAGLLSGWKKGRLDKKIASERLTIEDVMGKYARKSINEKSIPARFINYEGVSLNGGERYTIKPHIWLVWHATDPQYLRLLTWFVNHPDIDIDYQIPENGKTALMFAAMQGNGEVIDLLLANGADPDLQDHEGRTALMHAVRRSGADCDVPLATLLSFNPDLSLQDRKGLTAVMHALKNSDHNARREVMTALQGNFGNAALKDRNGLTARQYAERYEGQEFLALFDDAPAPRRQPQRPITPDEDGFISVVSVQPAVGRVRPSHRSDKIAPRDDGFDCSRITDGTGLPPAGDFADKDVMMSLIDVGSKMELQEALRALHPNLTWAEWQEIAAAVKKRGWGSLRMAINPTHFELARNPVDYLDNYRDPVKLNVSKVALELFDRVNWSEPKKSGYLTDADRFEDGETHSIQDLRGHLERFIAYQPANHIARDAKRLRVALCRLQSLGSLKYKAGMTPEERQRVDGDILKRNLIIVEMARAGRHCFSRHSDTLSQSLQLLLADDEANVSATSDFRYQLIRSLKNKRRDLVDQALNQAPDGEWAHAHAYWLQMLGHKIGLPEYPPMTNFRFQTYVGDNSGLSQAEALAVFLQRYQAETLVDHLKQAIGLAGRAVGPRGAVGGAYASSQDKDYNIDFNQVHEWLKNSSLAIEDVMDDSYTEITNQGAKAILFQMGDFLTMELP